MWNGRFFLTILIAVLAMPSVSGQPIRVTELPQQRLRVTPGQYSGITWVSGNRYAVVDDKLPGGGIVFFDIPLRPDGAVRTARVRQTVPDATMSSPVSGLDNEGVTYADGKLYVSAEGDQSIREYEPDGTATGAAFPVPADLGPEAIVRNGGFEAFTSNAETGRFWVTTEMPLKEEGEASLVHCLQRFDASHQPDGRWLYRTDAPERPVAENNSVMAYVHGISALTALDDGRLIVLEREVYVPAGRPRDILDHTFSKMKLYVVDPSGNPDGILPKQFLCAFETRLSLTVAGIDVALANYEGMCLGPRLSDGRRCLILIADSQGGMASLASSLGRKQLTCEFVKVILLEGEGI